MSKKEDFSDIKILLTEMLEPSNKGEQNDTIEDEIAAGNSTTRNNNKQIDMNLAIKEIIDDRKIQIKNALERIENGSYGTCLSCGKAIVRERLEAIPEAIFCIDCQKKKERQAESMINLRDTFFPDQIN